MGFWIDRETFQSIQPRSREAVATAMSFLGLEEYHVFITGAAGGIASAAVKEFLSMYITTMIEEQHLMVILSLGMSCYSI